MAVTPFKSSDNFNMAGFNEKITEADNTYVAKTGDSMSGALSMGNNKITDVANPMSAGDAVNKGYVDENMGFKKKLIFDGTVNASANTCTIMNTSVSYDEGIDLKGIIIKVEDAGRSRNLFLTLNGTNKIQISKGMDFNSQFTSTIMFILTTEEYDRVKNPAVLCIGHTIIIPNNDTPIFGVPKDKSSNYYTYLYPDGALNSNVKIWGLF